MHANDVQLLLASLMMFDVALFASLLLLCVAACSLAFSLCSFKAASRLSLVACACLVAMMMNVLNKKRIEGGSKREYV